MIAHGPVTPLPGTLDGAIDRLALCDLRAAKPFEAEGGDGLTLHCVLTGAVRAEIAGHGAIALPCCAALLLPAGLSLRLVADPAKPSGARKPDARVMIGQVSASAMKTLGFEGVASPLVHDVSLAPGVAALATALGRELDRPGLGTVPMASALMKLCLVHAARELADARQEEGARVESAVAAVLSDPGAPHSIASLAALVRMSRATFIRHFGRATGMNPIGFVSKARLDRAAEMLRVGDLPVKIIAARSGFKDRSHFSRAFRRAHGMGPSEFRKTARADTSVA